MADRFLDGKWMMITGASKGFGRELALLAADAGSNLILTARSNELLGELREQVLGCGVDCLILPGDLRDSVFIQELGEKCLEKNLDILVNNAGVVDIAVLEDVPMPRIDEVVELNLLAPIKLTRALIGMFKQRKKGVVVFVNSAGGKRGVPEHSIYCASKFGITGFIESLKIELKGQGVRILSVCPGKMATELFNAAGKSLDTAEFIPPEEVAESVIYMLGMSSKCGHADFSVDRK